jgi:hypothetical protein
LGSNFGDVFAFDFVENEIVNSGRFVWILVSLVHEPDDSSGLIGHFGDDESFEHRDLDSVSCAESVCLSDDDLEMIRRARPCVNFGAVRVE